MGRQHFYILSPRSDQDRKAELIISSWWQIMQGMMMMLYIQTGLCIVMRSQARVS
uniref:Uncharacterized protein n=1 Tax=Arion vulgaris TaxID=1028688 RepID=A0A0B7APL0_9EUPU